MDIHPWWLAGAPWSGALLGGIFLLAAVSKLRNPLGFAAVLDALGIERPVFRKSLNVGVPLAEAALGFWLLSGWSPLWSALTVALVLILLTAILLMLRREGYTGPCGCFVGESVGPLPIVRNGILFLLSLWMGLEAYVAPSLEWQRSSLSQRLRVIAAIAVLATLAAYIALTRKARASEAGTTDGAASSGDDLPTHPGELTSEVHPSTSGPAVVAGATVPSTEVALRMELPDLAGARVVLGGPNGDAQLVVFAKGRCPGCRRDRDLLNNLPVRPPMLEAVIVCGGDLKDTMEFASEVRPPIRVVADPRWRTAIAWQVTTTPFSVLIDRYGRVRARGPLASVLSILAPRSATPNGAGTCNAEQDSIATRAAWLRH